MARRGGYGEDMKNRTRSPLSRGRSASLLAAVWFLLALLLVPAGSVRAWTNTPAVAPRPDSKFERRKFPTLRGATGTQQSP